MDKFDYFELYYLNLQKLSANIRVSNPAFQAWEQTEEYYFELMGVHKYKNYKVFKIIKHRWNKLKFPTGR